MLDRVNQQLDESGTFADMPCELTFTEDNRAVIDGDFPQMATFEASKKLHEVYESVPSFAQNSTIGFKSGLER